MVTLDANALIATLKAQRNAALDEVAILQARLAHMEQQAQQKQEPANGPAAVPE